METTKHYSLRLVAAILSIAIALMSLPLTVFADELGRLFENQETEAVAEKEPFEVLEKRTATSKTFSLEDGSFYIAQYDSDIHYLDESGAWQEIDNTLTAHGSEISTKNAKIKFLKKTNGSNKIFTIQNGDQKLTLSLIGANKKITGKVTNHKTEFDDKVTKLEKMTTLDRVNASVLYEEILKDTDLEYVVSGVNIKENIIVKAKQERYCYSFELQLNNLTAELTEKGEVRISDPSMDQPVYLIPAPFMLDSAHQQSDRVSFELVSQGNGKYILTVNADPNWINADERVFPVTIDPPIYTNSSSSILDLDFSSSSPDSNSNTSNSLYVSNTWNTYWKLTKLPTIPNNAYITDAIFHMDIYSYDSTRSFEGYIGVYEVISNWDSSLTWAKVHSETNAQGVPSESYADFLHIKSIYIGGEHGLMDTYGYQWTITPIVKRWYEGRNYGLMLAPVPNMPFTDILKFCSNEYATEAKRPQLCITYRDMKGLENYWSYTSQSAGFAGTGYINNATGNLVFSIPTLSTTDFIMPITPTLVYQSACITNADADSPYGFGVQLNVNESIRYCGTIDGLTYMVYTDGDGTEHYLRQNDVGDYEDEDGLQLQLENAGTPIHILKDANHNTKTFDSYESEILLRDITDQNGNTVHISRNPNGRINSIWTKPVTSSGITHLNFTYNTGYATLLTKIKNVTSGEEIQLYYREAPYTQGWDSQSLPGAIAKLEYIKDGVVLASSHYTYTAWDGQLASVTNDISGYTIQYQYDSMNRVTSVKESVNGSIGQQISFTYQTSSTVVRTSGSDDVFGTDDDLITTYGFDGEGRAVSCYTTDLTRTTLYGASNGQYMDDENPSAKNNLKSSIQTSQQSSNYLLNGGFENGMAYWTQSGNVRHGYMAAYAGHSAVTMVLNSSTSTSSIYQNVSLSKGTHSVSMYIDTFDAKDVTVYLKAESTSNPTHSVVQEVPVNAFLANDGYSVTGLTFSADPSTPGGKENFKISVVSSGVVSKEVRITVDNLMLSRTNGAAEFDMIQMGHFESTSSVLDPDNVWSIYAHENTPITVVDSGIPAFGNVLRFQAENLNDQGCIQQVVYEATDELKQKYDNNQYHESPMMFTLSGWAKGTEQIYSWNSTFALEVCIDFYDGQRYGDSQAFLLPFDKGITDWQFVSGGFVTESGHGIVKRITVIILYMGQLGEGFFDNISLVQDSPTTNLYTYTDNGYLDTYQNGRSSAYYQYNDSGDVLYEVSSNQVITAFEYDNKHRVTKARYKTYTGSFLGFSVSTKEPMVSEDITENYYNVYEYNAYGQPTKIWTYDSYDPSKYMYTTKTYLTDAGSHIFGALLSEGSSYQKDTRYFYDQTNGRLLAVTYPDGNGVSYGYDAIGNLISTLPAKLVTTGTSYSYNEDASGTAVAFDYHPINQRLTEIQTATTTYHFLYDAFGNTTEISAGDRILADYSYNPNNGKLNTLTYSNGLKVKYEYDTLDRVSKVQYNIGENEAFETVYTYEYNSAGRLFSVTDHTSNEVVVCQYDSAGRLLKTYSYDSKTYLNKSGVLISYDKQSRVSEKSYYLDYKYAGNQLQNNYLYYSYAYDAVNGNLSVMTIGGSEHGYVMPLYDAFGRTKQRYVKLDGGTGSFYNDINYTYQKLSGSESAFVSQMESIIKETANSTQTLSHNIWKYAYDDNGNITQITDASGVIQNKYYYDALGQLIREDNRALGYSYTYSYDHAGNIVSKKRYAFSTGALTGSGRTVSYLYEDSSWGDLLTEFNGYTVAYDDIGNPTHIGYCDDGYWNEHYELTWQGRRLMSYVYSEEGGEDIRFAYNAEGIRTKKVSNGVEHNYILNGSQIIAETWTENNVEHLVYYLYDEVGSPIGIAYRTNNYGWTNFDRFYFDKNLQGDIIAVYNSTGKRIGTYTYDAWGKCSLSVANGNTILENEVMHHYNPFRYRGYYYDYETGFYYLQSRYYNPEWGRFLNADGYVSTGTGMLGYNMFAYCNNNPVMFVDPSGICPMHRKYNNSCAVCRDGRLHDYLAGEAQEDEEILYRDIEGDPEERLWILHAEHHKRGTTNGANKEKHEYGQARKQRDKSGEKGDARRKPNPNKRRPSSNSYSVDEKAVAAVTVAGVGIAIVWVVGNNATGVGVADDAALAGLIPIFWTNIEILNAY